MPTLTKRQALSALQFSVSINEWNADLRTHLLDLLTQAGFPELVLPDDHQIRIEHDTFYEPDGDYDLEEERQQLANGEWGAYVVTLERECDCGNWVHVGSLAGVVVEGAAHDNTYGTIEGIGDEYLRHVAAALLSEVGE